MVDIGPEVFWDSRGIFVPEKLKNLKQVLQFNPRKYLTEWTKNATILAFCPVLNFLLTRTEQEMPWYNVQVTSRSTYSLTQGKKHSVALSVRLPSHKAVSSNDTSQDIQRRRISSVNSATIPANKLFISRCTCSNIQVKTIQLHSVYIFLHTEASPQTAHVNTFRGEALQLWSVQLFMQPSW